jgi:superfamily II DNA or RNA helicase
MTEIKKIRPYQMTRIHNIVDYLDAGFIYHMALIAGTGGGKTLMSRVIAYTLFKERREARFTRAMILVPQITIEDGFAPDQEKVYLREGSAPVEISKGLVKNLRKVDAKNNGFIDSHINASGRKDEDQALLTTHAQIALYQRGQKDPLCEDLSHLLLIVDEAHHICLTEEASDEDNQLGQFVKACAERGASVLYLTATPFRTDRNPIFVQSPMYDTISIADMAALGYAPSQYSYGVTDPFGKDSTLPLKDRVLHAMVAKWILDRRPKALFILSSTSGIEDGLVAARAATLIEILRAYDVNVRIVNAVGTETAITTALRKTLKDERAAKTWEESQVDVVIACRRFDEGTDWPFCSHIYCDNVTESVRLLIQRLGRALRYKWYPDYPEHFKEVARIECFLPRPPQKDILKMDKDITYWAVLVACYLGNPMASLDLDGYAPPPYFGLRTTGKFRLMEPMVPDIADDTLRADVMEHRSQQLSVTPEHVVAAVVDEIERFVLKYRANAGRDPLLSDINTFLQSTKAAPKDAQATSFAYEYAIHKALGVDPDIQLPDTHDAKEAFEDLCSRYGDLQVGVEDNFRSVVAYFTHLDVLDIAASNQSTELESFRDLRDNFALWSESVRGLKTHKRVLRKIKTTTGKEVFLDNFRIWCLKDAPATYHELMRVLENKPA